MAYRGGGGGCEPSACLATGCGNCWCLLSWTHAAALCSRCSYHHYILAKPQCTIDVQPRGCTSSKWKNEDLNPESALWTFLFYVGWKGGKTQGAEAWRQERARLAWYLQRLRGVGQLSRSLPSCLTLSRSASSCARWGRSTVSPSCPQSPRKYSRQSAWHMQLAACCLSAAAPVPGLSGGPVSDACCRPHHGPS